MLLHIGKLLGHCLQVAGYLAVCILGVGGISLGRLIHDTLGSVKRRYFVAVYILIPYGILEAVSIGRIAKLAVRGIVTYYRGGIHLACVTIHIHNAWCRDVGAILDIERTAVVGTKELSRLLCLDAQVNVTNHDTVLHVKLCTRSAPSQETAHAVLVLGAYVGNLTCEHTITNSQGLVGQSAAIAYQASHVERALDIHLDNDVLQQCVLAVHITYETSLTGITQGTFGNDITDGGTLDVTEYTAGLATSVDRSINGMSLTIKDSLIHNRRAHHGTVGINTHIHIYVVLQHGRQRSVPVSHIFREGSKASLIHDMEHAVLIRLDSTAVRADIVHEVVVVLYCLATHVVIAETFVVVTITVLMAIGKNLGMTEGKRNRILILAQSLEELNCALVSIHLIAKRTRRYLLRIYQLGVGRNLLAIAVQNSRSAGSIVAIRHIDGIIVFDTAEDRHGTLVYGYLANHKTVLQRMGMSVGPTQEASGILRSLDGTLHDTVNEMCVVVGRTDQARAVSICRSGLDDVNQRNHILHRHQFAGIGGDRCRGTGTNQTAFEDDIANGGRTDGTEKRNLSASHISVSIVFRTHSDVNAMALAVQCTEVSAGQRTVLFHVSLQLNVQADVTRVNLRGSRLPCFLADHMEVAGLVYLQLLAIVAYTVHEIVFVHCRGAASVVVRHTLVVITVTMLASAGIDSAMSAVEYRQIVAAQCLIEVYLLLIAIECKAQGSAGQLIFADSGEGGRVGIAFYETE